MDEGRFFPLLLPLDVCRVCEGETMRPLHVMPVKTRTKLTRQLNRLLVGCTRCGVVYQHPLPDADELAAYYAREAGTETEGWDARTPAGEKELAVTLGIKTERSERYVQALELLAGLPQEGTRKALDFGCGLGAWLDPLQERGWQTHGIEPG
ncbi:MAG: hypothetical protein H0T13_02295, partial [Actinobacteria bacterium]|nr:hypothetical protein [Actinomycetota bacterium]